MTFPIKRIDDRARLQAIATPILCQQEAKNCLPIGIIDTLVRHPENYKTFYFWVAKKGDDVVGLAWHTPPHPLGVTSLPKETFPLLMDKVKRENLGITSIVGPSPEVDDFVESWNTEKGCSVDSVMKQRIYELVHVETEPGPGKMILATDEHADLVEKWSERFIIDCGLRDDARTAREHALKSIREQKSRYLWLVEDKPVSMAGASGRTPLGIRVNWVYTPDELRGHGYAVVSCFYAQSKVYRRRFEVLFFIHGPRWRSSAMTVVFPDPGPPVRT